MSGNPGEEAGAAVPVVLVAGGDLMAKDRIERAARNAGAEMRSVSPGQLAEAIAGSAPKVVVVDLDGGREQVIESVRSGLEGVAEPPRVIGYFSHIDDELGAGARSAGIEAMPRGRFWREIEILLGG